MLKNSIIIFLLFNLIQFFLVEINCRVVLFKPSLRHLHTATYVNNKLYILSGFDDTNGQGGTTGPAGYQFFYLDVSTPFNSQELLSWHDLTSVNILPMHVGAASVRGGTNNNTIIVYGGRNLMNADDMASVYMFDTESNSWNIPIMSGPNYMRRRSLTALVDQKEKIYLFGGWVINRNFVNDMIILDSTNLSFGRGSNLNAPSPRINYGAVMLPNQKIIYIGGGDYLNVSLPLNEVYVYDTINDSWDTKKTSGLTPTNRYGLSAVLGLDGEQIIIFGGKGNEEISIDQSLYTLNVDTFEWRTPKVSGQIPINNRYMHKANVIGNYMVVTFGFGYKQSESDVLLLDISNNDEFVWTTNFIPSSIPSSPSSPQKSKVIGAIVGSLIGGILLLSIGLFFLYKWNKNRKVQRVVLPVTNDKLDNDNNNNQPEQKVVLTTLANVYNNGQQAKQ